MSYAYQLLKQLLTDAPWTFFSIVLALCGISVFMSYLSTRSARKMQLAMHGRVIDLIHLRDQVLKLSILAELPGSDRDRLLGNIERAFETADKEFQVYTTLLLEKKGSERVSRVLSRTIW